MPARFALSLIAAVVSLTALPARAACSRLCDEEYDMGGSSIEESVAVHQQQHHAPPVEMSLPGYLWTKLRAEAHDYADKAAYALITATSKLALVAAREKQQHDVAPAAPAHEPHSECSKTPPA
jgi:hypothetical protein